MPLIAPTNLTLSLLFQHDEQKKADHHFKLAEYGIIEVSGRDASKLLQGQCTINVFTLNNKQAALSAICNIKGRVISLFYLIKKEEDFFWLVLPSHLVNPTIDVLKKYAVFFKVSISDISSQVLQINVKSLNNLLYCISRISFGKSLNS